VSDGEPTSDRRPSSSRRDRRRSAPGPWRIAEWVSLIVSGLIVTSLAVFLVIRATTPRSSILVIEARPMTAAVERAGDAWVLPVEVHNRGSRTATRLSVEVRWKGDAAEDASRTLELDYLAEGSRRTVYIALERDPRQVEELSVRLTSYEVD
jgi:uncharacterized protein (TIGR02588 family)